MLKNLPKLILLDLERTYISKIENLDGIPSLKFLMLKGTDIRKLEGLDSLINLEVLSLDASNDSDRKIIKMKILEILKI
ncbi:hypothetical protein [sulfur-oxidizing endosymbiont of Gigantopelta aegis]|uniref:hypothetical protein n=1 Tax=sulfur-oxidizing endosymbiont of Gigantopelta aegis TaxID=2794934 RepID=UPI001BE3DEC5|nr:hypothetical protein [sulfur-oxidizing endosymbiont of Gigantopelta aegis]